MHANIVTCVPLLTCISESKYVNPGYLEFVV